MAKKKAAKSEKDVMILTQAGYDELVAELDQRKNETRPEIAEAIKEAKALGDLSENNAYSDAMERKDANENRIVELEYMLSIAQVSTASAKDKIIGIGHTVEIQKVGGTKRELTLVGKADSQQADPTENKISIDSPIGMALNGAKIGDTVAVELPNGKVNYKIIKIVA